MLFIRALKPCLSERLFCAIKRGSFCLATGLSSSLFLADEMWLMALCFPVRPDAPSPFDLEAMVRHLPLPDLAQLFERAQHERLLPLLSWKLQHPDGWPFSIRTQIPHLPDEIRQRARSALRQQRKSAMLREALLQDVAHHLQVLDTHAILYKGSAYERSLYSELGLRPMVDTDIIVPSSAYESLCHRLEQHGYHRLIKHSHEQSFHHPPTATLLDVHRALSPEQEGLFDVSALFPLGVPLGAAPAYLVLPPAMLLLLHLFHLRGNGMNPIEAPLLSVVDLLLLAQRAIEERERLWGDAQRWRCVGLLRLADALLQGLFLTPPLPLAPTSRSPWEALQRVALPRLLACIRQAKHHAEVPRSSFQSPQDQALRSLLRFFCYDTLPDLLRSQTAKAMRLLARTLKERAARRGG